MRNRVILIVAQRLVIAVHDQVINGLDEGTLIEAALDQELL